MKASVLHNNAATAAVLPFEAAISSLKDNFLLKLAIRDEDEQRWLLETSDARARTSLSALTTSWRRLPAAHLPAAVRLARSLGRAGRELAQLRPQRFLISPAQVFLALQEDGREAWELAVLPLASPSLEQFAKCSPDVLAWLSPDTLLANASVEWQYLMGAALYHCLVDDLYPHHLPLQERIKRLLIKRCGNEARLHSAIKFSLPKSMSARGVELAGFIWSLLAPSPKTSTKAVQAAILLEEFFEEFSAPRLAEGWEEERNYRLAADVLNDFEKSAPREEVPWQVVARLRVQTGDKAGAAAATAKVQETGEGTQESFMPKARALAAKGERGRQPLEELCEAAHPGRGGTEGANQTRGLAGQILSDEEYLYLAYVEGRWLQRSAEALSMLERDFSVSWHQVIREVLLARLHAEQSLWTDVARHCRQARNLVEKIPGQGQTNGQYILHYMEALDGIAHAKAVEAGHHHAYLGDALIKLQHAWMKLHELFPGSSEVILTPWLVGAIRSAAKYSDLHLMTLGAEAFCYLSDISLQTPIQNASVPWFFEKYLFSE